MLANNETGVVFPIEKIGRLIREQSEALFHVDGVQAVGKIPLDLKKIEVDLFALSGHKFHAPQGIGALYVRQGVVLPSFIVGGAQEEGRRAGTSAVPNIVGLGAACRLASVDNDHSHIEKLRNQLEDGILASISNARLNVCRRSNRSVYQIRRAFRLNMSTAKAILAYLDNEGICVSTGSACHSSSHASSPTLKAMNVPYSLHRARSVFQLVVTTPKKR
jgi:cysteine desulfurase